MIYGYIRVSSDKQTIENQRFEINNFCERESIHIDGWIEETISGTKAYDKRQLGRLLNKVQKDDLIICAELSRLGRNLFMIMEILNICMTRECRVWTVSYQPQGHSRQSESLDPPFGKQEQYDCGKDRECEPQAYMCDCSPSCDVKPVQQGGERRTEEPVAQEICGQVHHDGFIDIPEPDPGKKMYGIVGCEQQKRHTHYAS